ncbi:MAG: hypothetical protein HN929_09245 [Chloroflexi bacterium]|jgi:endonuclease III related protein|nr:hypothetical protein [Chloroflexota bacterium]MBT7081633.1 hypothetical protein [Chloroflexota bacterium]MBT7288963.1 hypothetical protein [Chloroflexota bacterium]
MAKANQRNALLQVYDLLFAEYGPQHWWPAKTPFEVIIGAILTQSTAWTNVQKVISKLIAADVLTPPAIRNILDKWLADLIYSCGYYNVKTKKLKAFVQHLFDNYNDDLDTMFKQDISDLRLELLSIHGIGEETSDSIILYAANKPSFVIDAYTRRIFSRLGYDEANASYVNFQALFTSNLPQDAALFNEYHALIVNHGKLVCKKIPLCSNCCIEVLCKHQT